MNFLNSESNAKFDINPHNICNISALKSFLISLVHINMDSGKEKDTIVARLASKVEFIHERELMAILFEFGIIQISYSLACLYLFGFIKGIIIGLAGYYAFYFIMLYFGYEMINGIDSLSTTEIHPHLHRNWTGKRF